MSSHNYSLWLEKGHGAAGTIDFDPDNTFCPIVIHLGLGENPNPKLDGVRIFCRKEADFRSIAKAFRDIAEGIERTMLPSLTAEDLAGMSLGVIDYE